MENTLPITKDMATQVTLVTTTGVEKALTILGFVTISLFALIGLITIVILVVKALKKERKQ